MTQVIGLAIGASKSRENGSRENKEQRIARAAALLVPKGTEYVGKPTDATLKAWAKGEDVDLGFAKVGPKNSKGAACILCGGTHNLSKPERAGLITFYRNVKSNSVFALSDTCRVEYGHGEGLFAKSLTNPADYRRDFNKAVFPVSK